MSKNSSQNDRRQFLKLLSGAAAIGALSTMVPSWARAMGVRGPNAISGNGPQTFDLGVHARRMAIAGGTGNGVTINNSIPGPLLEWQEGRDVVLNVSNHLNVDTSIHWHGILLPFEMDGVPGVTFKGIKPGKTFRYEFPVVQSGTYWYHSHSGLQEQSGAYGPLVVHPKDPDPVKYDRDYVIVLSDWTFEDPHKVMAKLKKMSDYYNFQQVTVAEILKENDGMSSKQALQMKLAWDRMRMMPSDILDITGATYTYLMNGMHPAGNWTGVFKPGEKVRLRFINAAAMTFFNVRIPGLTMSVVAADGQNIQPVETDEFQFGAAETYDVVVQPTEDKAYTIMAESMDRSGYAAGTLAPRAGMSAAVPALRKRPLLTMVDMGMDMENMDMGKMDMSAMEGMSHGDMNSGGMASGGSKSGHSMKDMPMSPTAGESSRMDHSGMDHSTMNHADMKADTNLAAMSKPMSSSDVHDMHGMTKNTGPIVARHGPDMHGPGNIGIAAVQRDRLGERGTGLADEPHRVLVYNDLKRLDNDFDTRAPQREIELHLTGHMERYMWSFDGKKFHEVDGPIEFKHNERLRLTLVNDTMMNHPIHLHGMWMELENGHGAQIPRKHTINMMPASRVSALITPIELGRWAFHCHLLYHMDMGMFRVVRVS